MPRSNYPLLHPLKPFCWGPDEIRLLRGRGIYLEDENGKQYMDANSGLWNVPLGHSHPAVKKAVQQQLEELAYVNLSEYSSPVSVQVAQELMDLLPQEMSKVLFTCSGSESVEAAIKIARQWQVLVGSPHKKKIASFDISYHGTSYGAMSASGIDTNLTEDYSPKVPDFCFVPFPTCDCCLDSTESPCLIRSMDELELLFEREGETIAGFIIELLAGSGGALPLPTPYILRVKQLCEKYGSLLIIDEVATGFCRTGSMFAFSGFGIVPDLLCLAKGITNGTLPMGALVLRDRVSRVYEVLNKPVEHFSTQSGNPIGCAAARATIGILKQMDMGHVMERGQELREHLESCMGRGAPIKKVSGAGLMLAVHLSDSASFFSGNRLESISWNRLRRRGVLVYPFSLNESRFGFHLAPPLVIQKEEAACLADTICSVLGSL